MRKLISIIFALVCMTTVQARNRYKLDFDINRLASKLELTEVQIEPFMVIQENFNRDIEKAGNELWFKRRHKVMKAVVEDARKMKKVLTEEQFRTYILLLTTTLKKIRNLKKGAHREPPFLVTIS